MSTLSSLVYDYSAHDAALAHRCSGRISSAEGKGQAKKFAGASSVISRSCDWMHFDIVFLVPIWSYDVGFSKWNVSRVAKMDYMFMNALAVKAPSLALCLALFFWQSQFRYDLPSHRVL